MTQAFNLSQLANKLNSSGDYSSAVKAPAFSISSTQGLSSSGSTTALNFSSYSSIYGGSGGVTIAADNGSGGFNNTIQIVNNGKSVNLGGSTYIAPTWAFVSSINNAGTSGVAGIFDATGYAGSNALASCINSTSSNYALWGYGSALNTLVTTGAVTPNGTTGVNYTSVSDRRLKSNIAPLTDTGATIDALQPRTFTWNSDGKQDIGFIADELQQVVPNAVNGNPDDIDEEGKPKYQSIDCSTPEMVAILVSEIQSLRKRIATLEAKSAA